VDGEPALHERKRIREPGTAADGKGQVGPRFPADANRARILELVEQPPTGLDQVDRRPGELSTEERRVDEAEEDAAPAVLEDRLLGLEPSRCLVSARLLREEEEDARVACALPDRRRRAHERPLAHPELESG